MTDKIKFTTGGEIYEMKIDSWQRSNVSPSIELKVERTMTDIEQKALALWNAVRAEREYTYEQTSINRHFDMAEALCRAIEQHEAFRQEVSDAVKEYCKGHGIPNYNRFIIPAPKPDPLVEALDSLGLRKADEWAGDIRKALAARGLEIREKG